jgi:hypothetical protein
MSNRRPLRRLREKCLNLIFRRSERGTQQNDDLLKRVASAHAQPVIREERNVAAENLRGWGLEFSHLAVRVSPQPDFAADQALNFYFILKYGPNPVPVDIIEFDSYRGGSALFMTQLLKMWGKHEEGVPMRYVRRHAFSAQY